MAGLPTASNRPVVLWWGRGNREYSRNRVVRRALAESGWALRDFRPRISGLANTEAWCQGVQKPAVVWVPCFRQRDIAGAARAARRWGVPLIFDPLISAYDKQVHEREKFTADSSSAAKLLAWERRIVALADVVVADTPAHAEYFAKTLEVDHGHLMVIPVGAEADLFSPQPTRPLAGRRPEVLFYGSFIALQGPQVIVKASKLCPDADWVMLGDGPLRSACESLGKDTPNLRFEDRIDYDQLPARIARADIALGVFSPSKKAGRVVPNKVYQPLACGRPVVTRQSSAYPAAVADLPVEKSGLAWVTPGDAAALAQRIKELIARPDGLPDLGAAAHQTYQTYMSPEAIRIATVAVMEKAGVG